jgi:hypothetical protein
MVTIQSSATATNAESCAGRSKDHAWGISVAEEVFSELEIATP